MVPVQMSVLIGLKRTSLLQHEKPADVRSGSFSTELGCPRHVRFWGNLGNIGCPVLPVEGIGANYLAFIKLASIRIWLRANQSAP